jgi:Transposase DNA-binding/Transposase DDE domain
VTSRARREWPGRSLGIDHFSGEFSRSITRLGLMQSARRWAEGEFGDADLGDKRRTRRLVQLATEVATRPAGTVTRACPSSASREAAFRLLENTAVRPEAVRAPSLQATAKRCVEHPTVVVAVDATALTLTDEQRNKGIGAIGPWDKGARGVHAMSALAIAPDGSALGLCSQGMWVRSTRSPHGTSHLANHPTEMGHWLDALVEARSVLAEGAPLCRPWFQLDRGGDCWQVLSLADRLDMLITVRAAHDRRVDEHHEKLWSAATAAPVIATRRIDVPARQPRVQKKYDGRRRIKVVTRRDEARRAKVEVRAVTVPLIVTLPRRSTFVAHFNAVLVTEAGGPPGDALEWMLLTTHPIRTRAQVLEVVRSYCLRWRVEEFHRVWKRGLCRVEDTQLRSRDAIFKWATLLATVATRAMRLTQLARTTPDVPATSELTKTELEALLALREPKGVKSGDIPTLAQAVRWIADLGGYTGPWNGPPGATVIGRGLHDVLIVARALETRAKKR